MADTAVDTTTTTEVTAKVSLGKKQIIKNLKFPLRWKRILSHFGVKFVKKKKKNHTKCEATSWSFLCPEAVMLWSWVGYAVGMYMG